MLRTFLLLSGLVFPLEANMFPEGEGELAKFHLTAC